MTDHPAPYTDALLPIMAGLLPPGPTKILDPFCGTGKIARLKAWLPQAEFFGYEIEPEWADQARAAGCAVPQATAAICTTPTPCSMRSARARPTATAWRIITTRATAARATPTATCSAGR